MKKFLIPLLAGCAMAGTAYGTTFTTELPPNSDAYGVFWCQLMSSHPARAEAKKAAPTGRETNGEGDQKEPGPMTLATSAEFDQNIKLHIKDLGQWWTVLKQNGQTDEKSLDSFISHLVLIIDGLPVKHLHPNSVSSFTPEYPYHSPPEKDAVEANRIWENWARDNVVREAENNPTCESAKHVESRAGAELDVGAASGASRDVLDAAKKARANPTGENELALKVATTLQVEALNRALHTAEQLKKEDLEELKRVHLPGNEQQTPGETSDGVKRSRKADPKNPPNPEKREAIGNVQAWWGYLKGAMEHFPGANDLGHPFEGEAQTKIEGLQGLARELGAAAVSLPDLSALNPPAAGKGERYHQLTFHLVRKDEDQNAWMEILRPDSGTPELARRCRISVGFEKDGLVQEMVSWVRPPNVSPSEGETEDAATQFFLVGMPTRMLIFFGAIFLFALVVLIFGMSGLLRDHDAPPRPDGAPPYSLARCQMALWFFLISLAFVFLWQMLGRKDTINNTAVVLLGISSFTAVGSALITSGNRPSLLSRRDLLNKCRDLKAPLAQSRQDLVKLQSDTTAAQAALEQLREGETKLEAELTKLEAKVPDPDPTVHEAEERTLAEKRVALARQAQEIADEERQIAEGTKAIRDAADRILAQEKEEADCHEGLAYAGALGVPGFFKDLLRDGDQHLSIARFQMMIWTLVLAFVFTVEVYSTLSMPEFNPALLALLGVTSGTYLGFKGATRPAEDKKP